MKSENKEVVSQDEFEYYQQIGEDIEAEYKKCNSYVEELYDRMFENKIYIMSKRKFSEFRMGKKICLKSLRT